MIDEILADCVVPPGEVVCGILLSRDELLWVEELTVSSVRTSSTVLVPCFVLLSTVLGKSD